LILLFLPTPPAHSGGALRPHLCSCASDKIFG